MKKYIIPAITIADIENEVILAGSGGLNAGDNVGNQKPTDDNDDNFFGNRREGGFDWN